MAKKVLMATANHWNSPFKVGSHEIAKSFIRDNYEVLYLSDPISPLHYLKKNDELINDRFRIHKQQGEKYLGGNLLSYVPYSLFTPYKLPLLNSQFIYKRWDKFSFPNIIKKIREFEFDEVEVLYFDSIYQSFLLNSVKHRKSVFRIADKNSGFSRYGKNSAIIEKQLASSVDVVLYTAENLAEYANSLNPKRAEYFPNGVDFNNFNGGNKELPEEFNSIPSPRILYIGAIHEWFDFELMRMAATELSNYSFVLIGNDKEARQRLADLSNVHILGLKKYSELSKYIYNSDVGIIPFNTNNNAELVNSINPLKLYQYLACGLPVVSVSWDEINKINPPALLYKAPTDFVSYIKHYVEDKPAPENLIDFAKQFDWQNKYLKLKSILEL